MSKQKKRGPGRPPAINPATSRLGIRATDDQRATWIAAAEASGQSEAVWAREALDNWTTISERAAKLGTNPDALVREALEDHARVRAAVAELTPADSLSPREARVLRILAPSEWAARHDANE